MKEHIMIIILALLAVSLSCEREISETQSDRFIKHYGSDARDMARDVEVMENGGYAICGTSSWPDGTTRMVLIVTDEYGNPRSGFPKYYSQGDQNAGANALVSKKGGQGGFLICGYSVDEGEDEDIYIVRVNTDGDTLWTRQFGSPENEAVLHATEGITSGFLLVGYQEKDQEKDILVMGIGEQGDSIPLGLNYNKPFNSSEASANFILKAEDSYLCVCSYNKIIGKGTDILVLNFDDELSPNDEVLSISGNVNEYGTCIIQDNGNVFLVLGNRNNAQTGKSEILVYAIETSGLLIRDSELLATISEIDADLYAERVVRTPDGRFAIVGTRTTSRDSDIFLQFLQNYQIAERLVFGSSGDQTGVDIGQAKTGGLILLGSNGDERHSMISLIKTDDSGNL